MSFDRAWCRIERKPRPSAGITRNGQYPVAGIGWISVEPPTMEPGEAKSWLTICQRQIDLRNLRQSAGLSSRQHGQPMAVSVETLWKMSDTELLAAYYDARRVYVEKKHARDTQRARLEWLKARAFAASTGGVTERKNAVDASEDLGRKGQEVRDMTRDMDLLKADVDVIVMIIRLRGAPAPGLAKVEEPLGGEEEAGGG